MALLGGTFGVQRRATGPSGVSSGQSVQLYASVSLTPANTS